ncbi:ribosomal protein L10e/L16 [Umbelopsis sp. PMI_123]|nr:ribosomal protein L10e/L16 [Umbelopsis sp. PMI_123]
MLGMQNGLFSTLRVATQTAASCFSRPSLAFNINVNRNLAPLIATRFRSNLAPRRTKYRKSQKGKVPLPTGGSTKGTTVEFGDYGLRVKEGTRLSAKQITAAYDTIRRKIKPVKGSQLWMRVFPDIPVSSKGNEVRMGKGKGSNDFWACRVPLNRVVFEIAGMRKEIAKEALRLASDKLPVRTEFIERNAKPVVGAGFVTAIPPRLQTEATKAATSQVQA